MSTNVTYTLTNYSLAYSIKFAVLISLEIPSILVSLLIFAYFGTNRNAREARHNHAILVLLLVNFLQVITDLPMPMSFFHLNGSVQPAASIYCTWWTWYEFSLNTTNGFLMAWISIERHLFIFHIHFLRGTTSWKRRLVHIVPLIVCSLWGPVYYIYTIIISPMCTNTLHFDTLFCGYPCYLVTTWGSFDLFFDVIFPTITIFIGNLVLFIRVVLQQMAHVGRTRNNWRRQKKMAFQLGIISFIYLAVWIPLSFVQLGQIYIEPNFLLDQEDTIEFLVYIVPLILPMVCLMSMPELIKKLKLILFIKQHPSVKHKNTIPVQQNNIKKPSLNTAVARF
jgi:phosphatidylglycerophosphate synthase